MVDIKFNLDLSSLKKIQGSLEKTFDNFSKKSEGTSSGGSGALAIGGAVAVLTKLLSSVESVVGLLEIIGGLINQLVAPFVPILLGLIKPVFILLQKFLFGALSSLGVSGFGAIGDQGIGEQVSKWLLGILGGIGAAIIAGFAGASVGWAAAIGAAILLLVPVFFDLGKSLGEKLFSVGTFIGDMLANGLLFITQTIFDIFGINLLEPLKGIIDNIIGIFSGLIQILIGVTTLDWELIKKGFTETFTNLWNLMKTIFITAGESLWMILSSAWDGLKNVWQFLLDSLKSGIMSFANLFIGALNGLISILNKVPGVDIGRVSNVGRGDSNTSINVTIQGNTDNDTVDTMLRALRREQQKRGTGTF